MIKFILITTHALALLAGAHAPALTPTYEIGNGTVVATSIAAAQQVAPHAAAVVADVEAWQLTPLDQRQHPAWAIRRICHIAHAAGASCIAAPAMDLFGGSAAAYLKSQVTSAAQYADAWVIQSQAIEQLPKAYHDFVAAAAKQVRAAHSGIRVLAGLTTHGRHGPVTRSQLKAAWDVSHLAVGGYWLNVPGQSVQCPTCGTPAPQPMARFLKEIS